MILSVGHYFHQDGILRAEAVMRFLYDMTTVIYYPMFYSQYCLDIKEESIKIEGGRINSLDRVRQAVHIQFTDMWFEKIKQQQNL